jgi:glycine cleavage system aminomethyltransferase T
MTTPAPIYHLALRDLHAAAGATFANYAGWSLPVSYGLGPPAEHQALRASAVLMDRSHRSRFLVTGTDALDVLNETFAGHVEDLEEGRAMRTARLDGAGQIDDLVLVARTGGIAYLVIGEPSQRPGRWLHCGRPSGRISTRRSRTARSRPAWSASRVLPPPASLPSTWPTRCPRGRKHSTA